MRRDAEFVLCGGEFRGRVGDAKRDEELLVFEWAEVHSRA